MTNRRRCSAHLPRWRGGPRLQGPVWNFDTSLLDPAWKLSAKEIEGARNKAAAIAVATDKAQNRTFVLTPSDFDP